MLLYVCVACSCFLRTQVQYLNDYASVYQLNIQYNTNITRVEKEDGLFHLTDQHGTLYTCHVVIVRCVTTYICASTYCTKCVRFF